MKKTSFIFAAMLTVASAHADEGMWTLYDLPRPHLNRCRQKVSYCRMLTFISLTMP